MQSKTDVEVAIGGKVFTLSGNESEEYLQKVATYINGKISEFSKAENYKKMPVDTQNILIQLNIADDYFKAREEIEHLKSDLENKDKAVYDLKHELIAAQIKLENMEKSLKKVQAESSDDIN